MKDARLVVFAGPPCSGKSTLAKKVRGCLSRQGCKPLLLEMDAFRLHVLPNSNHTKPDRDLAYRCMHYAAGQLLRQGAGPVLLTATYFREEHRREVFALLCGTRGGGTVKERFALAELFLVQCAVEPEDAVVRFLARRCGHAGTDLTTQRVRQLVWDYPYFDGGCRIDTSWRSPRQCLDLALAALGGSGLTPKQAAQWVEAGTYAVPGAKGEDDGERT